MEEFDGEMEGLPSKDLLVEPPLPPSLLGSAIGGGLGLLFSQPCLLLPLNISPLARLVPIIS